MTEVSWLSWAISPHFPVLPEAQAVTSTAQSCNPVKNLSRYITQLKVLQFLHDHATSPNYNSCNPVATQQIGWDVTWKAANFDELNSSTNYKLGSNEKATLQRPGIWFKGLEYKLQVWCSASGDFPELPGMTLSTIPELVPVYCQEWCPNKLKRKTITYMAKTKHLIPNIGKKIYTDFFLWISSGPLSQCSYFYSKLILSCKFDKPWVPQDTCTRMFPSIIYNRKISEK